MIIISSNNRSISVVLLLSVGRSAAVAQDAAPRIGERKGSLHHRDKVEPLRASQSLSESLRDFPLPCSQGTFSGRKSPVR